MSKDKQHPDILWDTRAHDDIEDDTIDRKTLADQINESKELKELEYRKQLEASNSSYKLDEKSAQFYDQLKSEEREKERLRKEREAFELNKLRVKKAQLATKPSQTTSFKPVLQKINKKNTSRVSAIKKPTAELAETTAESAKSSIIEDSTTKSTQKYPKSTESTETSPDQQILLLGDYSSDSE